MKLHMLLVATLLAFGCATNLPEFVAIPGGVLRTQDGSEQVIMPFYIERTEVSLSAYRACFAAGRCRQDRKDDDGTTLLCSTEDNQPANCVSPAQAMDYCAWRNGRLPTMFEWQWVAQGREENRDFPWGAQQPSCDVVVFYDTVLGGGCGHGRVAPVGSRPAGASRDGILDIVGNVSEFVLGDNGAVFTAGGTSWDTPDEPFRADAPRFVSVDFPYSGIGFWCVARAPRGR